MDLERRTELGPGGRVRPAIPETGRLLPLSEEQKREIHQWLTEAGRQYLSFPQSTSKPTHMTANNSTTASKANPV